MNANDRNIMSSSSSSSRSITDYCVSDCSHLCNQLDKLFVVGNADELEVVLSGSINDDLCKGTRQTALVRLVEVGGWLIQSLNEEVGRRG